MKIYSYPCNPRVYKILITAEYSGVKVEQASNFQLGVSNKSSQFLSKFPFGKVPSMDTEDGPLFESNAMAYYIANGQSQLIGTNVYDQALIQQYINMADNEISPASASLVYPLLGYVEKNESNEAKAKEDIAKVLSILDTMLLPRTFLVGERITLADISVFSSLYHLYTLVLDPSARANYLNVNRWFETCMNQPHFKTVLGETKLCTVVGRCDCVPCPKDKSCQSKPCSAPCSNKPIKPETQSIAATSYAEEEEGEEAQTPKAKNPLDLLPVGKFDMDSWKRFYSNNETCPDAINYFWNHYDESTFCMYRLTYKFNEELTKVFMSSNLVGGFFQRLEDVRKYAFGSLSIYGVDNNNVIAGMFIFRGPEVPQMVKDVPDYDSFEFEKVNSDNPTIRAEWENCIAWKGTHSGKPFNCAKVYK